MFGGDGNHNQQIDTNDKDLSWESAVGEKGYLFGDYNLDGEIDNQDKNDIWIHNGSKVSQVPD